MKKIVLFILAFLIAAISAGCGEKIIQSPSDELTMYDWSYEGDNKISATLNFYEDDTARLEIYENGAKTLEISGACIVNDKTITITDKRVYLDLSFEYKLTDSECIINYEGYELPFKKQIKKNNI